MNSQIQQEIKELKRLHYVPKLHDVYDDVI